MIEEEMIKNAGKIYPKPRNGINAALSALIASSSDILFSSQNNFNCPARKKEAPAVKAKKKQAAKNQKINRQRAGKKRKFSNRRKK